MANNDQILNEVFFKKKSYMDNLKDKQAQYKPVGKTDDIKSLFNGNSVDGFVVSDTDEVKKRIVSALGMAMGNNTVKTMANKAIKSFPIIMSNDLTPETAVMVKNAMEEQYASWIDLLVSNQIINLTDYDTTGTNGNIAMQALNRLDGTDFGKGRLARQAQTGSLTIDDIMKNNPGWQFVRTNEGYETGNAILDTLFENAIIVPSEYTNNITESLYHLSKEELLTEANDSRGLYYNNDLGSLIKQDASKLYKDYNYGYTKHTENGIDYYTKEFGKLISPSAIVASDASLQDSLDRSIAEVLSGTSAKNAHEREISTYLKDRFEKASYLLTSGYISGGEYISYLTERLGIPVSQSVRQSLVLNYRTENLIFKNQSQWVVKKNGDVVNNRKVKDYNDLVRSINNNEKYFTNNIAPKILGISAKDVAILAVGAVGGGAAGAGVGAGLGALGITAAFAGSAILWPIAAGAAVGGASAAIARLINRKHVKAALNTISGWERVEQLIDELDLNRNELVQHAKDLESRMATRTETEEDIKNFNSKQFKDFTEKMDKIINTVKINEEINNLKGYRYTMSDEVFEESITNYQALEEEIMLDKDLYTELTLTEAKYIINTKKPTDVVVKQTKYSSKDVASVVPTFGTRDVVAYGEVEYDRKALKDRKYNEPLILTIKFKERYSDGKYNDNELTAVIGILGVITRVPSEEMTNVLKANAEGKTLSNLFGSNDNNNSKDLIGNVISSFMGSKYAEKLPVSGKVWSNLEKVAALAVANKLAGNNNGNISNAHLVFSQREIDNVKNEIGVDYLKNARLSAQLMKKYSAFMLMICNDAMQYVYTFNDLDAISWDDAPYSAYMGKSNSDQLLSAFTQYNRTRL